MTEDDFIVSGPEPDLDPFREATKEKMPWAQRASLIRQEFPSVDRLDWNQVFRTDPTIMGRLVNDILKIDLATPNKPGKRPSVDPKVAAVRWRELQGDDFSIEPFADALKFLMQGRSLRSAAAKTGISKDKIFRYLNGEYPTAKVMEAIAKAFKKDPGYFQEYRLLYVLGFLYGRLEKSPESSIGFYRKLRG